MVHFIVEECQLPRQSRWLSHFAASGQVNYVVFVTNLFSTAKWDVKGFFDRSAAEGSKEVLEFLVKSCDAWSADAFKRTVERPEGLAIARWIYEMDQQRASRFLTDISTQIEFNGIDIFKLARQGCAPTAIWLLSSVPQVELPSDSAAFHQLFVLVSEDVVIEKVYSSYVSSSGELNAVIAACLEHRPTAAIVGTKWLPLWAVVANDMHSFERLETVRHGEVYSSATRDAILKYSRNGGFMLKLLQNNHDHITSFKVIDWAAKYQRMLVLHYILLHGDSKCATLRSVAWTAARCGHVGLLEWTYSASEAGDVRRVFRDLAFAAARYGHTDVLQWLWETELVARDAVQPLYRKALRYGHVQCIEWADHVCGPADPRLVTWAIRHALDRLEHESLAYPLDRPSKPAAHSA